MSSSDALKDSHQLNIAHSSRKRKRQFYKFEPDDATETIAGTTSCFTNAAFSSTPKKILVKSRASLNKNNENEIHQNVNLEKKSDTEISNHHLETNKVTKNPYEVLRKPPKKKKRHTEEAACFENLALNLEIADKIFNPYEVVREATSNKSSNCFANPALNLKVQDVSVLCNPFEVQRVAPNYNLKEMHSENEVKPTPLNPFVISPEVDKQQRLLTLKPCQFKLGLPFVPRVGCCIDFNDISISQLTPSKLMAEKLVFSPVAKSKVSLGSTGEETTMDIGRELDRYQLELENSINEAKLRKTVVTEENILLTPPDNNYQVDKFDLGNKSKLTQKLCGITEEENEQINETKQNECHRPVHVQNEQNLQNNKQILDGNNTFRSGKQGKETATVVEIENLDELYGCPPVGQEDEESFDFKTPSQHFVRAYTQQYAPKTRLSVSKECLESNKSKECDDNIKKSLNVKNIIRKSIRKIMNTQQQEVNIGDGAAEKPEYEKNNGLVNVIRQSLRRKTAKSFDKQAETKMNEVSIIDSTERTMKLKSDLLQTEYIKIENLTNEKKYNLRNSIKKSTREVCNHFLKSVSYKRHEEYGFYK